MARLLLQRCPLFALAIAAAACALPPLPRGDRAGANAAAAGPVFGPEPPATAASAPEPALAVAEPTPLAEGRTAAVPSLAPAPVADPSPALPPVVHTIVANAEPRTLEVAVGQELVFENRDTICHSFFSSSPTHAFDVGLLLPAARASVRFARPGTVHVYCALHEHRQLTIRVVPAPSPAPSR